MRPGARILVTRAGRDGERWCERLRQHGAEPVHFPCVFTEPLSAAELDPTLQELTVSCPWWWFTSRRGIDAVAAVRDLPELRYAAVGEATAARLRHAGREARLVGRGGAADLARRWLREFPDGRGPVALLVADRARDEASRVLGEAGVATRRCTVYRTLPRREARPEPLDVDAVLVASPSAVEGLCQSARLPAGTPFVSIGPQTTRAVRDAGLKLLGEASRPDIESMLEVLR